MRRTKPRSFRTLAFVARLAIVIAFLLIPAASATFLTACLVMPQSEPMFGRNTVGETRFYGALTDGAVSFTSITGWKGNPLARGSLLNVSGVQADRAVVTLTGQTAGDVITWVQIQWWIVLIVNALPLWLAFMLIRRMRRRNRMVSGRCPTCGYDLRASPERCPECGTPRVPAARPANSPAAEPAMQRDVLL